MSDKIKIGIVEDEVIIADSIRIALESLGYETPEPCVNYDQAIAMLESQRPDLALLDIKMRKSKDGIEVARYIRERLDIPIIFLTANSDAETLQRAKTVKPNAFLTKPFQKADLYIAIEIALSNFIPAQGKTKKEGQLLAKDAIFIKEGHYFHKVKLDEIIYLSSEHVYVTVHTTHKNFLVRSSLQDYLQKFDPAKIVRVHQRYAVNISKVDKINSAYLLIDKIEIPVSKSYHETLMASLPLG